MAQKLIRGLYAVMAVLAIAVGLFFLSPQRAYAACAGGLVPDANGNCCPQSALNANAGTDSAGLCCPTGSPDASGACQSQSGDATMDCGAEAMNWIFCTGITVMQGAAQQVDRFIMNQLAVNTQNIFGDCTSGTSGCDTTDSQAYYTAWNSFRIIATGIVVLAGLVMIVAQATGFEAVDAYTIRKVLPRLGIAIIGIQLSWPLLQIVINFFNVVGYDLREIMYSPFAHMPASTSQNVALALTVNPLSLILAGIAAKKLGLFRVLGPSLLPLLITVLLGALIALTVLVVRQIAIVMLVVFAPVAIACYVLPGTQKVWKLWADNFMGLMLMFLIISMLIAAGHIMSAVSRTGSLWAQFVSIIAYFVPYFLLPMAFKMATGFIGNISGMMNDRSRGVFDRLRKWGQNSRAAQHQRMMNEQVGGHGRGAQLYRRVTTGLTTPGSGAFGSMLGVTRGQRARARANYEDYRRTHGAGYTSEALKNDNGRAAGDDIATALAVQPGMSRKRFLQEYAAKMREGNPTMSEAEAANSANAALAMTERGFGAQMGSSNMELAALKARSTSSTAYDNTRRKDAAGNFIETQREANARATAQRKNEAAALVRKGVLTTADAVAAGKGNRSRLDISGGSFGAEMGEIDNAVKAMNGETVYNPDGTVNTGFTKNVGMNLEGGNANLKKIVGSADPSDWLAGNGRAAKVGAVAMFDGAVDAAKANGGAGDHTEVGRALAQVARASDNLNRTSPEKAADFDELLHSETITLNRVITGYTKDAAGKSVPTIQDGVTMTMKQAVDLAKAGRLVGADGGYAGGASEAYSNVRHEYGSAAGQAEGEAAAAAAGGGTEE